ncbi:MAG TPA: hypothetical protein DHV26_15680 [Cytophagales bacterium]|nr:hypothetical protein [Cytophagales bacterium]
MLTETGVQRPLGVTRLPLELTGGSKPHCAKVFLEKPMNPRKKTRRAILKEKGSKLLFIDIP